ncbi:TPA: DUF2971 domain-containing protein [Vibrio parahaemolyticus]|nr:DUF2971 domain-containing protein [Vibrio parahaemolyticus]TOJ10494.1 hypothetical protein CGI45_23625 [Vibrio parahaemolyticus]HAS6868270.1 DUF2971 domain-containing protein [Vibrio parahaemolyticus]HAV1516132.1 DUF2971 domain-containing protein [Vibrio parahaemolyticus]HCH0955123.1 DUF2971 domain-containing protein [Vibrio parahaemolyticus]
MLVKYYGLVFDSDDQSWSPRADFISNGLFRITQPKYLNDKGSESRLWPYFNEFSPADYAWVRKEHYKLQAVPSYVPSNEELENFFLKPCGIRYGEQIPHMLRQEGFQSMEEYDKERLVIAAERINSFIVEALSCQLGVLSLAKSDTNELMWTHYASEGKGLAVTFDEEHPFFSQFPPKEVSYTADKRASLTYYKGSIRINGAPIKNFQVSSFQNSFGVLQSLLNNGLDVAEFSERLLYSKAEQWSPEDEVRIVCPLILSDKKIGPQIQPDFGVQLPDELSNLFPTYAEINLKQIPFDAFESIVFGYSMSDADKLKIIELVGKNENLSHLKLRVAKHNIFGKLEAVDLVV